MNLLNYRIISLTLCVFLLSACSSTNKRVDQPKFSVTNIEPQKAKELEVQERELPKSIYHPIKAVKPSEEVAASYELAKSLYEQGRYQEALYHLNGNVLPITSSIQLEAYLLAALASSHLEKTYESFHYLKKVEQLPESRHPDNQNEIKEVTASILEHFRNWLEVVYIRMDLSDDLSFSQREENQQKLWLAIQNLTQNEIDTLYQQNTLLNGWLSISKILRNQSLSIEQQLAVFETWQQENPNHPAALSPPQDFQIMSSLDKLKLQRVVLMLPMDGNLGQASQAIINGFFSIFYNQEATARPQVSIINVNDYSTIDEALKFANQKRPDIIIGPLQKSNVAKISHLKLPYPVIALNQLAVNQASENLFYFSLSAEDEIHELISFAKQKGAINTAILSTQDTWALKQSDEFRLAAKKEGIKITSTEDYDNTSKSRQNAVQKLLLVNESHSRKKLVEKWTGSKVDSIARSRKDLDYIYYIGKLNDAKQIRPLLDFYFAEKIPMLASSTLNDNTPEKSTNPNDIERIIFTEISALAPKSKTLNIPSKNKTSNILRRLQALGADAYLLANKHLFFTLLPSTRISANTGIITIDENGIFHKRPEIMTYRKGNLVYATSNQFFKEKKQAEK